MRHVVIALLLLGGFGQEAFAQHDAGGGVQRADQLDPHTIPQFADPLVIPPAMPLTGVVTDNGQEVDYYEIAVRQFDQQILPAGFFPQTTVWGYGSVQHPGTIAQGGSFNYPSPTLEGLVNRPIRVKWINDLVDANGNYLPHLFAVDQTLHWANPVGTAPDTHGHDPAPYTGPVPISTHVHGAHTTQESDGYPEAWFLPAANNLGEVNFTEGSKYAQFSAEFQQAHGLPWGPGYSISQYPNNQRATSLWYHDHSLGMTRLNVYAGPVGFWMLRGGAADQVDDAVTGDEALLPGPYPRRGDGIDVKYNEIPLAIQDRSFTPQGQIYYPDNRAYFESLEVDQLQIPFSHDPACGGTSDISGIWLPEFFGNAIVVNGRTWPYLDVEQRRYRFRLLNGCQSRFLILKTDNGLPITVIGADGGFLVAPAIVTELVLAPAERADVIIDFGAMPIGTQITLQNIAPDAPYGGGVPGVDFAPADPQTTGRVMQFHVVTHRPGDEWEPLEDETTPAPQLALPTIADLGPADNVRQVSLNEQSSSTVLVSEDANGNVSLDCANGVPFGPQQALLGSVNATGGGTGLLWMDPITENPLQGSTEVWEIFNFTGDAHPIHLHLVMFQVVDRQALDALGNPIGVPVAANPWENGFKDTVIAFPGEVTRVKAQFDIAGLYVWHCHILEHEDNEMMRPYQIVPNPDFPVGGGGDDDCGAGSPSCDDQASPCRE